MLVLTRKNGEEIQIGKDIKIEVLSVAGQRVRLGISAPKDVSICRSELLKALKKEAGSNFDLVCVQS